MERAKQRERGKAFRRLHEGERPLVLVNAWDAVSARVFEEAGAPATSTTSAGMAWSLGHGDGERLPREELVAAVARIARVVQTPLTVDVERGFGATPADVRDTVRALIELGAVGINLEDGRDGGRLRPASELGERIAALRALAREMEADLFVNARTDAYFVAWDDPKERFAEASRRAREFAEAGADGIFVPGIVDVGEIARLARDLPCPLNVYAGFPGVPGVAELGRAGARRVSLGCGPLQSLLASARAIAGEAYDQGGYATMTAAMLGNGEVNALFG